jgi:hypothetical protein
MPRAFPSLVLAAIVLVLIPLSGADAFAQASASTASLSGTVADSTGAVIPGADVSARNNGTGAVTVAVTDATGNYTIPALEPGAYTVTISLMGFKSVTMPDVQVTTGTASSVRRVVLEIGQLQETVVVTGATQIVQTESATVATTLTTRQILTAPLPTRNTLEFVASLPGVITTSNIRGSTVMGLPGGATNITIDGVNVQDNYLKSTDGFFARINPRLDAVEEVTVSTVNPGAESAGQGAVQIRFVTRSGTNRFQGSAYEYARRSQWNTNYWFNERDGLPKEQIRTDTYGGRVGGPVLKDKLFYFFNYEEYRQPSTTDRRRTVLTGDAVNGIFRWNGGPAAGVNVYTLAASKNQVATPDPTTQEILLGVQAALAQGTLLTTGNPITRTFTFQDSGADIRRYPTTRVDYNVTSKHRVGVSYYYQQYRTMPDGGNGFDPAYPNYPGAGGQNSNRWSWMGNWRWTVSPNMVSELRGGANGGPVRFDDGVTASTFVTDFPWSGFAITTPIQTSTYRGRTGSTRDAPVYVLEDTVSWLRGKHSIGIGGSFTQVDLHLNRFTYAPGLSLGVDAADPAYGMFTTANFPGASTTDLTNARSLYALLTGRVTQVAANANLDSSTGRYVYNGDYAQAAYEREFGFYIQDGWRVRSNLTLTGGIRWELQLPFVSTSQAYSRPLDYCNNYGVSGCTADASSPNLFAPGSFNGQATKFKPFPAGDKAYQTQYYNFAPTVGAAWRPALTAGFLEKLLSPDPVFRAGYSKAYTREGMQAVAGIYSYNPGGAITATRSMSLGTLVYGDNSKLPLLLRNGFSQFGPPPFQDAPAYPLTPTTADATNEFYPQTRTPYAHSWNVSFQRTISKNTAVDIRYSGTRMVGGWWVGGRNLNEVNTIENGFLNEFKLAQANLRANVAGGKGATYAYTGVAGTSPLPIMLAWLNGRTNADSTSAYTGSGWTNSVLYNYLNIQNPQPQSFANYLQTNNPTYAANANAAGLASNFFIVNPAVSSGGAWVSGRPEDDQNRVFDALQIELRRRMSGGFLVQGSYQYIIRAQAMSFYSLRNASGVEVDTNAPLHALKANWVYDLPFGQGKKWAGGVGRGWNMLVGGWSWNGNLRTQSGNRIDFGDVRLIGMTDEELRSVYKLRFANDAQGKTRAYMLPQDIIDQSIKAYSFDATSATGYSTALGPPTGRYFAPASGPDCVNGYQGQCTGNAGLHHFVTGPAFFRVDMAFVKRIDLTKRVWTDIRADVLNVFDNVNFVGVTGVGSTATSGYEVTTAYRDSNTQDPGGRLLQLSVRISF